MPILEFRVMVNMMPFCEVCNYLLYYTINFSIACVSEFYCHFFALREFAPFLQVEIWRTDESLLDDITLNDIVRIYGIFREVRSFSSLYLAFRCFSLFIFYIYLHSFRPMFIVLPLVYCDHSNDLSMKKQF